MVEADGVPHPVGVEEARVSERCSTRSSVRHRLTSAEFTGKGDKETVLTMYLAYEQRLYRLLSQRQA